MSHHRIALLTIACTAILDVFLGLAYAAADHLSHGLGLYWAVQTATTTGYGDLPPRTVAAHWIAVLTMVTIIPLWTATFSLFTSGLVAIHVRQEGQQTRMHAESVLNERRKDTP